MTVPTTMSTITPKDQSILCSQPLVLELLFGALGIMLLFSVSWNIYFCVSKCCSGKKTCERQSARRNARQMEDNPIYGNVIYKQTNVAPETESDLPHSSSHNSSSQTRIASNSQDLQDCYANLTLKPPRMQSAHSSPQSQHMADVGQSQAATPESDKDGEEDRADTFSDVSDLYASVQTNRPKTVNTSNNGEEYANHL